MMTSPWVSRSAGSSRPVRWATATRSRSSTLRQRAGGQLFHGAGSLNACGVDQDVELGETELVDGDGQCLVIGEVHSAGAHPCAGLLAQDRGEFVQVRGRARQQDKIVVGGEIMRNG